MTSKDNEPAGGAQLLMINSPEQALVGNWPLERWQCRRLLVAVSGGADSVALLRALHAVTGDLPKLTVAHFNHGWRGAESDADEHFCKTLASDLSCHFVSNGRQQIDAAPKSDSADSNNAGQSDFASLEEVGLARTEQRAREVRYQFLIRAAYEAGASYVVTGHTADDRAETTLHNLFRGAGLAGLASLRQFRPLDEQLVLVRPLLTVSRASILGYLQTLGQAYRTDSSNSSAAYKRNFIRRHVLPLAQSGFENSLTEQIVSCSELAEEALDCMEQLGRQWLNEVVELNSASRRELTGSERIGLLPWPSENFWIMPAQAANRYPWPVMREALRLLWMERGWPLADMTRGHWQFLRAELLKPTSALEAAAAGRDTSASASRVIGILPGNLRLESYKEWIAIGRKE